MFKLFKKEKKSVEEVSTDAVVEDFSDPEAIITFFKNETGVTFEKQRSIFIRKLTGFCRQRKIFSFKECLTLIERDDNLKEELINYLTTNESYFYREFSQIKKLVSLARELPKPVTVLSAPCATGEEPYSIALALLTGGLKSSDFTITGIDINTDALKKAQEAKYNKRSVHAVPKEVLEKYFTCTEEFYVVNEEVKKRVEFKEVNIFTPSFENSGKFDFVLSRNMLIYFDKETKLKAQSILEDMRKDSSIPVFFGHADLF